MLVNHRVVGGTETKRCLVKVDLPADRVLIKIHIPLKGIPWSLFRLGSEVHRKIITNAGLPNIRWKTDGESKKLRVRASRQNMRFVRQLFKWKPGWTLTFRPNEILIKNIVEVYVSIAVDSNQSNYSSLLKKKNSYCNAFKHKADRGGTSLLSTSWELWQTGYSVRDGSRHQTDRAESVLQAHELHRNAREPWGR